MGGGGSNGLIDSVGNLSGEGDFPFGNCFLRGWRNGSGVEFAAFSVASNKASVIKSPILNWAYMPPITSGRVNNRLTVAIPND